MSLFRLPPADLAKILERSASLVPGKPNEPKTGTDKPAQNGGKSAGEDKDDLLKTKLGKASLREIIAKNHANELRGLPGGVFNAPKLAHMVEDMLRRFVATGMVDPNLKFDVMLASTPDVNGWVKMDHTIKDAKIFYVTLTKGLLDLVSDTPMAREMLGPEVAAEIAKNGEAIIAAVLAHELGHAMNGDLENVKVTTRVFNELAADHFSVELLARAGYAPEAAIELMQCFEKLHSERTSIASRVAQLTDEHPKPRFRVAALVDLVETLKRTSSARADFGLPDRGIPQIPARPLPRDPATESVSKQGLQGVERRLASSAFDSKSTRDKLRYLEQYFASYNAQNGVMERQSAVAIVHAYQAILDQAVGLGEVDQILVSHRAFEANIGGLAGVQDDRPSGNVRAACRQLKADALRRKTAIAATRHGPLTVSNFHEYAQHVDRRYLAGELIARCRKASTLDELSILVETRIDNALRLRNDGAGSRKPEDLDATIYRAATERAIDLTGSLADALDFLQKTVTLSKSHQQQYGGDTVTELHIPGEKDVFVGMMRRALERPGIDVTAFVERMQRPKTSVDRAYATVFQRVRWDAWAQVKKERGEAPNLAITDRKFTYGVGRSHLVHRELSSDMVKFVHLSGGGAAVSHYFNILAGSQYTVPDALRLIARANPARADAWRAIAPTILEGRSTQRGDDPHSQLRLIVQRLCDTGIVKDPTLGKALTTKHGFKLADLAGTQNPYLADVHNASLQSRALHYDMVRDMMRTVIGTSEIIETQASGDDKPVLTPLPVLSPSVGYTVPPDQRVAYLDMVAKAEATRRLTTYAPRLEANRKVVVEGLDELVAEKRITAEVKDEFLAAIDDVVGRAKNIATGGGAENDAETYVAQRRLRLMCEVLSHTSIGLDKKLTLPTVRALNGLRDSGHDRPTTSTNARQMLSAFLVASKDALGAYLENPKGPQVAGVGLGIADALAERVAFYEGLGSLQHGADIFGFDASAFFARSVHSPRRLGSNPQISFKDELVLGKANRSTLAPLGPAFEKLVTGEIGGHRTGWQAASWYKDLLESAWPYVLHRALTDTDPVHALGFALGYIESVGASTEVVTKFSFAMLTRALELVQTKADMDVFASLFALFVDGSKFGTVDAASFMKAELKEFAKVGQLRYRQHFYDRVVERLDEFQSWRGLRENISTSFYKGCAEIARRVGARAEKWRLATKPGYDPVLTSLWVAKKTVVPALSDKPWLTKIISKIKGKASEAYTHCLVNIGFDTGRISRERLFGDMQRTNVWSEKVDGAIAGYVRAGTFEKGWTKAARRSVAVGLTKQVKSLAMREELYRDVLKTYGEVSPTLLEKAKNYWKLYQAYLKAKEIWTEPVLKELEKTNSVIEAWKITERAWEDFVNERASERGVPRDKALELLLELYNAKVVVDCPPAGEIAGVFMEGSAHRDGFLEDYVKSRPMTVEQMKMFQSYKSRNTETPYHKLAKAFFEFIDDEAGRLSIDQRADVALFLSGVSPALQPATEERLKAVLDGNHKRKKLASQTEARLRPAELRTFVAQAHPDEKLVAFRGLLLSGVIGDAKAEAVLTDKLLFQDPSMPAYLKKLLKLFLGVINDNERSIYLSYLLANSSGKPLSGPEIVRFLIEKGGVVAAKVAQLVASYGFDLPPEYRAALEKFKGKAQKIDKMVFMDECKKRLPADKYDQIATFDQELGSGSFKIGYAATLKDGRRIVIMMPRAYVIERTAREFEITRKILDAIMQDPDLARDNFAPLRAEVERIVKHEMHFDTEAQFMKDHKANHDARPWLVNAIGGEMKVLVPQPLEGWHTEDILVEEYVDAKGFTKLPERSMFGWSQEKLARAALAEVLNQMMSFMRPDLLVDGKVALDIDPHEENQLARTSWFGQKQMVNIDLGQSVMIEPEKVRGLVQMLGFIKLGKLDEAVAKAVEYMDFASPAERATFSEALAQKRAANADPFEVLGQTLEETGFKGVFLKPEYLYFQKLFATIVGLKRHIKDPGFIMKRAQRIFALHAIASPSAGTKELKGGWLELQRLAKQA